MFQHPESPPREQLTESQTVASITGANDRRQRPKQVVGKKVARDRSTGRFTRRVYHARRNDQGSR